MAKTVSILPAYLNIPGEQVEYSPPGRSSEWPNIWSNPILPPDHFYPATSEIIIFEEAETYFNLFPEDKSQR